MSKLWKYILKKGKIHLIYIALIIIIILFFLLTTKENGKTNFPGVQEKGIVVTKKESPYDHIKEMDIKVFKDKVVIDVKNVFWSRFADSHSMEPIIAKGANGLSIIPESENDIHVGDIVTYTPDIEGYRDKLVIHRIIKLDNDDKGWYAIIKGDNLPKQDPGRIRFNQIKRLLIGIIY